MKSNDLFDEALRLPERERAKLAGYLILSLEAEAESGVEALWDAEIQARLDQLEAGDVQLVPAEEVIARLLKIVER
ncbi:MAG: hypothetical protein AMXMBFR81_31080 [Chthonomonas sp.]|nr:addiction module protein [Fimbriimonadaceae bacterium]